MRRHSLGRSELKKASYADGEASRITWVGAAVNLFLSISKLVAGIVGNSAAMLSDAGHSLSDLVSDALTLVTLRMSALPPDIDHPYGHGRFESVGSLGIATLLLLAGLSFGQNAFAALRAPSAAPISVLALWAAVATRLPAAMEPTPLELLRQPTLTARTAVRQLHSRRSAQLLLRLMCSQSFPPS